MGLDQLVGGSQVRFFQGLLFLTYFYATQCIHALLL